MGYFVMLTQISLHLVSCIFWTHRCLAANRQFPNYLWPLFQSECWCSSFHMKISLHSHANENNFSYERMSTRTRFEKEAKGNSEMAYYLVTSSSSFALK